MQQCYFVHNLFHNVSNYISPSIKRDIQVVKHCASYSADLSCNFGPKANYSDRIIFFVGCYTKMLGRYVKLGHDRFPSQLV